MNQYSTGFFVSNSQKIPIAQKYISPCANFFRGVLLLQVKALSEMY
jgi:hypothetical protein